MAAVTKKVSLTMSHTKTTKNWERYDAEKEAKIQNLYIAKGALGDTAPQQITISVEAKA